MTWATAALGNPTNLREEHQKLLSQIQKKYSGHYLTVKAKVSADVGLGPALPATINAKGEITFGPPLNRGAEATLKIYHAKDLLTVKFVTADKRLEIIPRVTHRETAASRRETRVFSSSSPLSNTTITSTYPVPPQAEVIFFLERENFENAYPSADGSADTEMIRLMEIGQSEIVELATAGPDRQKAQGKWFPVRNGKLFSTIEFLTGIIDNCRSKPEKIADLRHPESQFIATSHVLNTTAERVTLAYYIRVQKEEEKSKTRGYFSLLSYDLIGAATKNELPICATEFFLFGPFSYASDGLTPDTHHPTLLGGLAIGADGQLLTEVPLGLAKVANYSGGPPTEPIRPGVNRVREGCLKCHGGGDSTPDSTGPFPWGK